VEAMSTEAELQKIEAIIFDAYGTLFDLNSVAEDADKIYPGKGRDLLHHLRSKQLEYAWLRTIIGKYKDFESITKDSIRFALKKLDLPVIDDAVDRLYSRFLDLNPHSDVENALNDLDSLSIRVSILSNGTQEMMDKVVEHAGLSLLAEEVVSVEGSHRFKPHPAAYQHGLDRLEIYDRKRALYISGNTWDVAGAKSFGMLVGWVNRTRQPFFDQELLEFRPDYEFEDLRQIKQLLRV
jgi:2-haloacid dehalogenase